MKRKWIDLFLFYVTVFIIISGIVLYIMPHGRVAYFTGWKFLGIDKDGWDNLHVIFGFIMVVVAIWHIVINWKVMKKYLFQKESLIALSVVLIVGVGSVKNVFPFSLVTSLEESIKNSWEVNKKAIPIAHGELLSLREFCNKLNINLESAVKRLKLKGYKFKLSDTLKEIALKNNTTPADIYEIIKSKNADKTLKEFCKENGIDIDLALKKLNQKGIKASKKETLREIADNNGLKPREIVKILK